MVLQTVIHCTVSGAWEKRRGVKGALSTPWASKAEQMNNSIMASKLWYQVVEEKGLISGEQRVLSGFIEHIFFFSL